MSVRKRRPSWHVVMTLAGATAVCGCSNGAGSTRTGAQEESAEAHAPEGEVADEGEVVAAAEAPPAAVPALAHARVAGAASWSGQVHGGEVFSHALARLVEPCFDGGVLPRDLTVSVPVATDGSLGEASLAPMGAGDEARLTCIRAALTVARVDGSGDPLGGHLTVPLRVEAATAERAPFTFPAHPDDLCVRDADCVLITGDCTSPAAARDLRASERARQNQLQLSLGECAGGPMTAPVRAVCTGLLCATTPSDHPEWRLCRQTSECVNVPRHCGGWDVVARRAEREARAAFAAETPGCSTESDPDDTHQASCRYGFCAFEWRNP
jgi:hypothetical protein